MLRERVRYVQTLEVAGLANVLVVLGAVVTLLLVAATGNPDARPALSCLVAHSPPDSRARALLDLFNVFHFWLAAVLAIGLAKVTATAVKETAFWVFGYWIGLRLLLLLLA